MGTAAIARAGVGVEFRATGVEAVRRGARDITRETDRMQSKFGGAARQMAMAAENIARTGNASGEALKQLIAQGSEMALMFAGGGAIVGAIGIAGLAVYNFFDRTRKEMIQTRVTFVEELERMARAGDLLGAARSQQYRFSGDPNAIRKPEESSAAFLARSRGMQGVRGRIEELRAMGVSSTEGGLSLSSLGRSGERAELKELLQQLGRLKREYAETTPILARLNSAEGERTQLMLRREADAAKGKGGKAGGAGAEMSMYDVMGGKGAGTLSSIATGEPFRLGITFSEEDVKASVANLKTSFGAAYQGFLDDANQMIQSSTVGTLGSAIASGFRAAFSGEGIGAALKSFAETIMSGLGGLFIQMGETYLLYGGIMKGLAALLPNPFTAGYAGLAIGAALIALGGALQGVAGGGGGGHGGGAGSGYSAAAGASVIDRGIINPLNPLSASNLTPRTPQTNHFTVIGENDPRAQRQIVRLIQNAGERGSL